MLNNIYQTLTSSQIKEAHIQSQAVWWQQQPIRSELSSDTSLDPTYRRAINQSYLVIVTVSVCTHPAICMVGCRGGPIASRRSLAGAARRWGWPARKRRCRIWPTSADTCRLWINNHKSTSCLLLSCLLPLTLPIGGLWVKTSCWNHPRWRQLV